MRVRRPDIVGLTCCAPIEELAPPLRCAPPKSTLVGLPLIGRIAVTGDGGSPPPVKMDEREPPQMPCVPIAPEALRRFSTYPRASPRFAVHMPAAAGCARLVLK